MTIVRPQLCVLSSTMRSAGLWMGAIGAVLMATASLSAQQRTVHPLHAGVMPPGAIGGLRLERGGPVHGYFQPIEIGAPPGARISMAERGAFSPSAPAPALVGVLVAQVYRFQVTGIPNNPGAEVFPTIEVIDRLYPPPGQFWRFPIPVQLTQDELELAIDGKFVTRVIYVEDPDRALPNAEAEHGQSWFEAGVGDDPLMVADEMGRPVAILRMGGRLPDSGVPDEKFLFGSPPILRRPSVEVIGAKSDAVRPVNRLSESRSRRAKQAHLDASAMQNEPGADSFRVDANSRTATTK